MNEPLIALTGATGFIGRYLLRALPRLGYRVRVLLRRPATVPLDCANAVIGDLARPINIAAALADVHAVVHSAALTPAMSGAPEEDFRLLNATATAALAQAARRAGVRRFVFMSSLRAQTGPSNGQVLTEEMEPRPTDAYGRSKLAAEQELAKLDLDWVALRLALVCGAGAKGNMARLVELARSPYPLPFGALGAKRSLLSLPNLAAAVQSVLIAPQRLGCPLIVADPVPVTLPEMITAMRAGLGRKPRLVAVPPAVLERIFRLTGRSELYARVAGPLVCDPSRLMRLGWVPPVSTADMLAAVARGNEP
ncbi:MAG: NAD-dependent epimerase/dehydratase family protein [Alphaproteobacteria bacterium]|nr:MAG: NAD-dependent epimerase/dehydratase family protein [Alphaproteobacteria bacterium]